jgi:hypothetical protein
VCKRKRGVGTEGKEERASKAVEMSCLEVSGSLQVALLFRATSIRKVKRKREKERGRRK